MKSFRNRILTLLLGGLVLTTWLTACSSSPAPATTPAAAQAQPQAQAQPAASTGDSCLGSASEAIVDLKCRQVRIAVENVYLPFNYVEVKTGKAAGWDYDAWNGICTRLHCTPVFTEAAWESMIQGVASKQYDAAANGISITPERSKTVDFSNGYIQIQQRLLVRKGETRINKLEDLKGNSKLILGTQANTTNYDTAKAVLPETQIKAFEQFSFAVQALISSDVDAVIIDEVAGMGYMGENSEKVELRGPQISSDQLGFAFPKGSDLVGPVNQALEAMRKDGSLDKINAKYFGADFKVTQQDIKQ